MGASDVFAESGFLLTHGPHWPPLYRSVAGFVDRLLKGAKVADLPVQQPAVFSFIINIKSANASGLTIAEPMQLLVNRVIE
jgi:putative ABC transport system substrate-binding protein